MCELTCFGTPVIDLYYISSDFPEDQVVFSLSSETRTDATDFTVSVGGGAVNVAIGVKKLGLSVSLAGIMGENSFTETITRELDQNKITYPHLIRTPNYQNISLIMKGARGERSIVNYRSPITRTFSPEDSKKILRGKTVFMANLPNLCVSSRSEILAVAKAQHIQTVLNLGIQDTRMPLKDLLPLFRSTDILIMNSHEFAALVRLPYHAVQFQDGIRHLFGSLRPHLPKLILITDAEQGSYAYTDTRIVHQQAIRPVRFVDENGAGDAFTAGFLSSWLRNGAIEESLLAGARYAARILSVMGAH